MTRPPANGLNLLRLMQEGWVDPATGQWVEPAPADGGWVDPATGQWVEAAPAKELVEPVPAQEVGG